jgi:hypothetical protein
VSGDAKVSGNADILVTGPIGSRNVYLTVTISNEKATTGCFYGSLDDLEKAATENKRQDYLDLLPGIRAIVARRQAKRANLKEGSQ